jgi:hypothetical protein
MAKTAEEALDRLKTLYRMKYNCPSEGDTFESCEERKPVTEGFLLAILELEEFINKNQAK